MTSSCTVTLLFDTVGGVGAAVERDPVRPVAAAEDRCTVLDERISSAPASGLTTPLRVCALDDCTAKASAAGGA